MSAPIAVSLTKKVNMVCIRNELVRVLHEYKLTGLEKPIMDAVSKALDDAQSVLVEHGP
jgi:hypothetical protein